MVSGPLADERWSESFACSGLQAALVGPCVFRVWLGQPDGKSAGVASAVLLGVSWSRMDKALWRGAHPPAHGGLWSTTWLTWVRCCDGQLSPLPQGKVENSCGPGSPSFQGSAAECQTDRKCPPSSWLLLHKSTFIWNFKTKLPEQVWGPAKTKAITWPQFPVNCPKQLGGWDPCVSWAKHHLDHLPLQAWPGPVSHAHAQCREEACCAVSLKDGDEQRETARLAQA